MNIRKLNASNLLLFLALLFAGMMSASAITFASRSSGVGSGIAGKLGGILTSHADHAPISINGNVALDAFCAGNGTDGLSWATAYVIKDYAINGNGGDCIDIASTNQYLII